MKTIVMLLLLAFAPTSWTQGEEFAAKRKYCGSGLTANIVPDHLLGCEMSAACKVHDACYGRCDPEGDQYGSQYCTKSELSISRLTSKAQCDAQFLAQIRKDNPDKVVCAALGGAYTGAVVVLGQGPFNGRTVSPESLVNIAVTSSSPEDAREKAFILVEAHLKGTIDLNSSRVTSGALAIQGIVPTLVPKKLSGKQLTDLKRKLN